MILGLSFSLQSCKQIGDDDGNLLNNMDANEGGLTGPRYLASELVNGDSLIASYQYNGIKLVRVVASDHYKDISYNGDKINKIIFIGKMDTDSVNYTQYYTYDNDGKITSIAEAKTIIIPNTSGSTTTYDYEKYKSVYSIKYSTTNGKMESIFKKEGEEITGQSFAYTNYERFSFTYYDIGTFITGNIKKMTHDTGKLDSTGDISTIDDQFSYEYEDYDDKASPYILLPFGYNLNTLLESSVNGYHLSTNNPRKFTLSGDTISPPIVLTSTYTYDPQRYALTGFFGINYMYGAF